MQPVQKSLLLNELFSLAYKEDFLGTLYLGQEDDLLGKTKCDTSPRTQVQSPEST